MFDDELLQAYIDGFYGFGDYQAPYWFVGMEEGGGDSAEYLAWKFNSWHENGRLELEHMADERPNIQKTWGGLIRILLSSRGPSPAPEEIKKYQRTRLAHKGDESALLELMPLPSPSQGHWLHYASNSQLPFLKSRREYVDHVAPHRVARLQALILEHQPRVVVFYGKSYWYFWHRIAGVPFQSAPLDDVSFANNEHTLFVIAKHPANRGARNADFDAIGQFIGQQVGTLPDKTP
jgi:hypothetical protein